MKCRISKCENAYVRYFLLYFSFNNHQSCSNLYLYLLQFVFVFAALDLEQRKWRIWREDREQSALRVVLHTLSVHCTLGEVACIVYVFFIGYMLSCIPWVYTEWYSVRSMHAVLHYVVYCALCALYVCFLVYLERTLGNAVQCCLVSIWILCAMLVLLAALIWRQILLVVFVFRKKASRISGNYIWKNKWSDQRLWGLVTLIRGTITIACFVFLLHWSCICHPGLVTK